MTGKQRKTNMGKQGKHGKTGKTEENRGKQGASRKIIEKHGKTGQNVEKHGKTGRIRGKHKKKHGKTVNNTTTCVTQTSVQVIFSKCNDQINLFSQCHFTCRCLLQKRRD